MNHEERKRVGRLLGLRFRELGWTQEQLQEESGIDRRTIGPILGGKSVGQAATLRALADAMDLPLDAPAWQDDLGADVRNFLVLLGEMLNRLPATQRAETMRQVTATVAADLSRSAQAG